MNKIIEGAKEALAVAKGEQPAAQIIVNGHAYVPAASLAAKDKEIERLQRRFDLELDAYAKNSDLQAARSRAEQAERALKTSEAQLDEMTRSCLAEREGRLKAIEILTIWSHDSSLQTFDTGRNSERSPAPSSHSMAPIAAQRGSEIMDMTKQQKLAIRRPCFEAKDTSYPPFGWRAFDPTVTLRLTLNIGME